MILDIILSFITTLAAVIIALLIDRARLPKLEIRITENANSDITYAHGNLIGQRWKFFRVFIRNKKMPPLLGLLVRQTAENCRASVTITGINNTTSFTFKGRWANTPELPFYGQNAFIKVIDPDPITIMAGEEESLDVISKYEHDLMAYGWNNESYFNSWRTPGYQLNPGRYNIKITVYTQNGTSSTKRFSLVVGTTIEETEFIE